MRGRGGEFTVLSAQRTFGSYGTRTARVLTLKILNFGQPVKQKNLGMKMAVIQLAFRENRERPLPEKCGSMKIKPTLEFRPNATQELVFYKVVKVLENL